MNSDSPGWQPVDPSGISSVALPEAPPPGQLLVFASSAFEDDRPWVAETVAEIAREWADSAVRLLLMDLDLQGPGIHDAFDAEAAEGVSDVLLFGASISRVTQPVEGGAFHYAPAGTPVADPRVILSNDRWERVIRGCRDAGISLVVHLPLGQPGAESLLFRADRIVRLGRPHESGGGIPSELEDRVVATLTPAGVEEAPIVEIHELAPDDPVRRIEELAPEWDEEAVAEAPDEPVVDIAALAPDEPVVDVEELAPDEPVAERSGEAPVESDEEPASEPAAGAPEVVEAATEEAVSEARRKAPGPGPVVEIADLAPEAGEVEEVAPGRVAEGTEAGFGDDEFVAGLEAIDAAAAQKPRGYEGFDLEGLDHLADPTGRRGEDEELGGEGMEAWEGLGEVPEEERGEGADEGADEEADEEAEFADGLEGSGALGDLSGDPDEDLVDGGLDESGTGEETEEAMGFGGFSGELDLGESEAGTEAEPESGEAEESFAGLDTEGTALEDDFAGMEEEPDPDEGRAPDEGFVTGELGEEASTPDSGGEPDGRGLGDDLLTGPDFGQGAPEVDGPWDDGTPGGGGDAGEEAGAAGADAAAGRPHASGERPEGGREGFEERRGEGERAAERASHPGQEGAGEPVVVGTGVGGGGRRDRTRGRPLRLLALAVILAVGTVGAHWFGIVDVPGLDRVLASVLGPAGTGVAPTVDTSGPQPTSPVQSQSLLIDVYRDAQAAADVALALQDRLPDRLFGVAPVQRGGDVVHRLLAGPANTPDQAADLREALSQVLSREDPSGWSPQATSLAFVIDELPDLDGARARVQAATGSEVFGYVLEVTYPDGSTAYRVYAGGYSSPEEARALQGILSQAGIGDATFTERRGEVPE